MEPSDYMVRIQKGKGMSFFVSIPFKFATSLNLSPHQYVKVTTEGNRIIYEVPAV